MTNSWGDGAYKYYSLIMTNGKGASEVRKVVCKFDPHNGEVSLQTSYEGANFGFGAFGALLDNAAAVPVVADGETVGFTLTGTLLDTVTGITLSPSFSADGTVTSQQTSVIYASYDDLQITLNPIEEDVEHPKPAQHIDLQSWLKGYALGRNNIGPAPCGVHALLGWLAGRMVSGQRIG